jgi:sugar transferase (PEP-CTERM system associated)
MIRLFNAYYPVRTVILAAGEVVLIAGSFIMAVRFLAGSDAYWVLDSGHGLYKILGVSGLCFLCFCYSDLYGPGFLNPRPEVLVRLLSAVGLVSILLGLLSYLIPQPIVLPGVLLLGIACLTLSLVGWRLLFGWLGSLSYLREKVVILGNGRLAATLLREINTRDELGMTVVASLDINGHAARPGTHDQLAAAQNELSKQHGFQRIIVATPERRGTLPTKELLELRLKGVQIDDATSVLEKITGKIETENLNPSWLVFGDGFAFRKLPIALKRILSFVFATLGLLLLLPLILILMVLIKLDSPGSIFYTQKRVGLGGRPFLLYKFRTMRADAEAETGPVWASERDLRVTRVGRWLRRLRLDEMPQFYNVLRGEMCVVGPRPERPEFVRQLTATIPFYRYRHAIRPGITGWAQVRYQYGSSADEAHEKLKYDLYYIKHVALLLDLFIVLQTVKIVLLGRGSR